MLSSLKKRGYIIQEQLKFFSYEYRKATNFGKIYFLPKIHKKLHNVTGLPVISNCATLTEKCLELLDYHLKPLMKKGQLYIKDSSDFIKKAQNLSLIPENANLVMADLVGLDPRIPHETGLEALREVLDKREEHTIPSIELIRMADFVLKNRYFEFKEKIKQQISGTGIGTKFAPQYASLFIDKIEAVFLETQQSQPLAWSRYIALSGHTVSKNFKLFCVDLMSSILISNLHMCQPTKAFYFLTFKLAFKTARLLQKYLHYLSAHPNHTKPSVVFS